MTVQRLSADQLHALRECAARARRYVYLGGAQTATAAVDADTLDLLLDAAERDLIGGQR